MNRDAKIGLAVVLVVGLVVTALVGRSICKQARDRSEAELEAKGDPELQAILDRLPDQATASAAIRPEASATANRTPSAAARSANPATAPRSSGATVPPAGAAPALAAAPVPPATVPANLFAYSLQAGDSLWVVSEKVYGAGKYSDKIAEANPGVRSSALRPGKAINVPEIPGVKMLVSLPPVAGAASPENPGPSAASVPPRPGPPPPPVAGEISLNPNEAPPVRRPDAAERQDASLTAPAADSPKKHVVADGDTMGKIARKYLGDSKHWKQISDANPGVDPNRLKVGTELKIPSSDR